MVIVHGTRDRSTRNQFSGTRPSFLEQLYLGRVRWDLLHPFPSQPDHDRAAGDGAVAELGRLLREHVDPEEVDRTGELPDAALAALRDGGWLALGVDPELGGRGLSATNVFRVIQAAASWSVPVALVLAIQESIGTGAMHATVSPGPLRDELRRRVLARQVSGSADTEPSGAANRDRETTARPVDGGAAYVLDGDKIHIGNGPIADVLTVSATLRDGDRAERRLFLVDTSAPGFEVVTAHRFLGVRGFPNGAVRLRGVRVPAWHLLDERPDGDDTRLTPRMLNLIVRGRMYLIAAPSLALAKRAAGWARDFVGRRAVDGVPLGRYEQVRHELAECLADTYAVETACRWAMLVDDGATATPGNALPEQMATKNISSVAAWRVVDRAMALMAAEGYETAASKRGRGAPDVPLERAFRDARNFRISGGVDFLLDYWSMTLIALTLYYPEPDDAAEIDAGPPDDRWCDEVPLSPENREHLREVVRQVHRFAATCLRLARRFPDRAELLARQRLLVLLGAIGNELHTAALVLARAAGAPAEADLAAAACRSARHRLAAHWRELAQREHADPPGEEHWTTSGAGWTPDTDLVRPADDRAGDGVPR
ncbi:acyl-CoA dehydrogenase family protein [Actinosynnema sp. NPDC059797]